MNELVLIKQDGCPNLSTAYSYCRTDGMSFEEIVKLQDQMKKIEDRQKRFLLDHSWPEFE